MELGRVGIWSIGLRSGDPAAREKILKAAVELEELGYGAIWLGGSPGVGHARTLIEATSQIVVATGILSIWDHSAADVAAEHLALTRDHPGRFLLGLGASHEAVVGERYRRPYTAMMKYLDSLDEGGAPQRERVLAALGPRMLAASRDRAAGAHPYFITVEHTRRAREVLGEGPLLAPEVKVVLDPDRDNARRIARAHYGRYAALPNYTANLKRLGFTDEDLQDGGSDRLIDACFAIGGLEAVRERIAEHHAAGADHVAIQVITQNPAALPRHEWREIAQVIG